MSFTKWMFAVVACFLLTAETAFCKKPAPPPPAPARSPSPSVTDEFIHKQFGENCSLMPGPAQFVADMDGDGTDDLIVAAKCKNPMADKDEYGFTVADPYDSFLGYSDVKVTSTFASEEPERRGISLLIIHGSDGHGADQHASDQPASDQHGSDPRGSAQAGTEKDGWHSDTPKAKFLLINLPFKTLSVKRLALKKRTVLGIYMEERGEGEDKSSVVYWDGKRYKYQQLGSTLE